MPSSFNCQQPIPYAVVVQTLVQADSLLVRHVRVLIALNGEDGRQVFSDIRERRHLLCKFAAIGLISQPSEDELSRHGQHNAVAAGWGDIYKFVKIDGPKKIDDRRYLDVPGPV